MHGLVDLRREKRAQRGRGALDALQLLVGRDHPVGGHAGRIEVSRQRGQFSLDAPQCPKHTFDCIQGV